MRGAAIAGRDFPSRAATQQTTPTDLAAHHGDIESVGPRWWPTTARKDGSPTRLSMRCAIRRSRFSCTASSRTF